MEQEIWNLSILLKKIPREGVFGNNQTCPKKWKIISSHKILEKSNEQILFVFFFIFRPKNVPSLNPVSLTNFLMPGSSGNFRNTLWTYLQKTEDV